MSDRRSAPPPLVRAAGRRSLRARLVAALAIATISVLPAIPLPTAVASAAEDRTTFAHIFVMVLENQRYEDIVGNPQTPFINTVLEKEHASATRFFAPFHNSPSDYYAMSSGKGYSKGDGGDWGGTCMPSMSCSTDDPSVFQQLNEVGKSWRVYSEDQDQPCRARSSMRRSTGWATTPPSSTATSARTPTRRPATVPARRAPSGTGR
jgi:hypothetical protein